jgi:type II secretory pathway component GspD/PulD (secretin)
MITKVYVLKYASVSTSSIRAELKNYLSGSAVLGGSTTAGTTGAAGAGGAGGEDVGITAAIKKILSENGKVIEDSRTNSLIISDIPSRFSIIEATIARLDVPMPQVMLEVEMLDVSKNLVDKLGFEFSNNPFTLILPGGFMRQGAQFWMGESAHRESEGAVTLGKTFYQTLDFIRTQTDTKYLARPRLLTLNNETAEIRITTNESIGVKTTTSTTGGLTTAEPERSETGVLLRVTPQVNTETGEITMFIYPQVSEATGGNPLTSANDTFTFRDPEVRSTKSMVKVKDGETVIVGGLIRNEFSQVSKKIPILGDIPVIGLLFRHKGATGDKNRERELLVFITPHIIKESQMELAQTYMPKKVLLEREQQPSESTTERKKSITATLNNFVK